ncbi:hypothetical protein [Poseidonocella sedimentorum]|uniref:Cytochrome c554 and c-prime n=1 Tax=Poseidonocella sedimentorum TaxID=871652 RepID=A0A1I6EMC5_9RHOB|nr:hypothetical protein [Poseidonocella sedimentorum]SFR18658.1 hypothetical protein SAMN04515673_11455 [Poseidonocella sedimentorum]
MTPRLFASATFLTSIALTCSALAQEARKTPVNLGQTVPKPVFQLGDTPSEPHADGSPAAQSFLDFFNETYFEGEPNLQLEMLTKDHVVWFPPQRAGDTSLELVAREVHPGTENCSGDITTTAPGSYPITCPPGEFSTAQFCQACHDSALFVEGGGLPQMMYRSEQNAAPAPDGHDQWLANWSQYGDWSASIMRLATRDPIWQAQIETETSVHQFADPAVIQDVCFSCHGEMGERQLKSDTGAEAKFCTDMFYAKIPGQIGDLAGGKPYPFTGDCDAQFPEMTIETHQAHFAKYGSLARDGVSCETCHRIGPENGQGAWDGADFSVFYGPKDTYQVHERQTDNDWPLEYEFTASFQFDMNNIMAPDPIGALDTQPMQVYDKLSLATATNKAVSDPKTDENVSYLQQSVLCGSCHVLIVPQIPTNYIPGGELPSVANDAVARYNTDHPDDMKPIPYPKYDRPAACVSGVESFTLDNSRMLRGKRVGNPVLDPCVGLGYEQATYLEWLNSDFATEMNNGDTCQGCHMPLVTNPADPSDHTAIMAQSTEGLTAKTYRRHRLMGINLPVSEMFMQFPDVLGVFPYSDNVPDYAPVPGGADIAAIENYLLGGQQAIIDQATSQANGAGLAPDSVTADKMAAAEIADIVSWREEGDPDNRELVTILSIKNNSGHKFPSGAGFRRAFVKFEVLDGDGNTLWVSGDTNRFGAICVGAANEGACTTLLPSEHNLHNDPSRLQPHYETITSDDQVQIYEVQTVDDTGKLTSSTLALFEDVKDNRLLPRGFKTVEDLSCSETVVGPVVFGISQCSAAQATHFVLSSEERPSAGKDDPYYFDSTKAGEDMLTYRIPLSQVDGAAEVRATLQYQTIPPGFLAARFRQGRAPDAGMSLLPATERAIYLTSHLNLDLVGLNSGHPDNTEMQFSRNWTSSIHQTNTAVLARKP